MQQTWTLDADHPALAGHFPGRPVAPGVLVLARMVEAAEAFRPGMACVGVRKLKFLSPLGPGEVLTVACAEGRNGVRAVATCADEIVAEGQLIMAARLTGGLP